MAKKKSSPIRNKRSPRKSPPLKSTKSAAKPSGSLGLYAALVVLVLLTFLMLLLLTRPNGSPAVLEIRSSASEASDPPSIEEEIQIQADQPLQSTDVEVPQEESERNVDSEPEQLAPIARAVPNMEALSIPTVPPGQTVFLVIVIDDVGYDIGLVPPFLQPSIPMTFAVLPELRDSGVSSDMLSGSGKEVILHLPMESQNGVEPGAGTLRSAMSDKELREVLDKNLTSVSNIRGVNNHMGSLGTTDPRILGVVMESLRALDLFFLDSYTTADSIAREVAADYDISYLRRSIFLDNSPARADIMQALELGLEKAVIDGYAIMIGHVWNPELAEVLYDFSGEITAAGFSFASLSELIRRGIH